MVIQAMCQETKIKVNIYFSILSHEIMNTIKHGTCQINEHEDRLTEIPQSFSTHTHTAPKQTSD